MRILGIPVSEYDRKGALEQIAAFQAAGGAHQVVTINPEGIWLALHDESLKAIVEEAALVTADGHGVLWAAEQMHHPLPERVTGCDLLQDICGKAAENGWRVYLLGSKPGVAAEAAARLQKDYPGLIIAGHDNGYFRDREEAVITAIREAKADILFAGLGMPFQEKWLAAHKDELGASVLMGVGGSFDVLAGRVKRAPQLWQKLHLEWLWRLLLEPSRWRRYLVIPRYMQAVKKSCREKQQNTSK